MSSKIGVWVDRSKAVIVSIDDEKCGVVTIASDVEDARHPRCGTEGRCTMIPERRLKQHRQEIVRRFYRKVVATINAAGSILVIGPGMAKGELMKEINHVKHLRSRVMGFETADKMASDRLVSRVREFFDGLMHQSMVRVPIPVAVKR